MVAYWRWSLARSGCYERVDCSYFNNLHVVRSSYSTSVLYSFKGKELVESLNLLFISIANTKLTDTTKSSKAFLRLTSLLIPIQEIEKFRQKLKTVQTDHTKLQTAYDERVRRYPNP